MPREAYFPPERLKHVSACVRDLAQQVGLTMRPPERMSRSIDRTPANWDGW